MKTIIQQLVIGLFAAALLVTTTTGCKHTARGAGEDIENMGEKIQEKTK
jgi:predicted small secreted protein